MDNGFFTLTEEHVTLLQHAYVGWEDCEYGAPSIDCKRPYGNSSVEEDIAKILGWKVDDAEGLTEEQRNRAAVVHGETQQALQIILETRAFTPGVYTLVEKYDRRSWERVNG